MTIKRIITAAVALPLLILLIVKGTFLVFTSLIMLVSFLGLREYYRMALPERKSEGLAASVVGALLPVAMLSHDFHLVLCAITALILISGSLFLFRINDIRRCAAEVALYVMGFLYVPLLLGHLILVRAEPHGTQWIMLLLVIVMSGDSAAYYVGTSVGRRKLYPIVSPNKSVEGAVGGLAGSVIGAVAAKHIFFTELTTVDAIALALVLGTLGQVGDLFESLLKRSFGVKDSGSIVPGHGGILDRLDSILFASPALFYYGWFVFAR